MGFRQTGQIHTRGIYGMDKKYTTDPQLKRDVKNEGWWLEEWETKRLEYKWVGGKVMMVNQQLYNYSNNHEGHKVLINNLLGGIINY